MSDRSLRRAGGRSPPARRRRPLPRSATRPARPSGCAPGPGRPRRPAATSRFPSEPMTSTIGSAAAFSSLRDDGTRRRPARRPSGPALSYAVKVRARLVARATRILASAPALAFQADALTPAARRSGMTTPSAPKAAADRTTEPRLRGSVTPSRATISAARPLAARDQIVGVGVFVRRHREADALMGRPAARAARARPASTSATGIPCASASRRASAMRASPGPATISSRLAGTAARKASTTGLRPTTTSSLCPSLAAARSAGHCR